MWAFNLEMQAQDPIYSQYYTSPMTVNPAFSGTTNAPLISSAFRLQWPGFSNAYRTFSASYSQYFKRQKSGIGFLALADNAGDGILTNTRVSGFYSYRLQIDQNTFLQSGIEFTGIQSRLDWDKLLFEDQIDPVDGPINPGGSPIPSSERRPNELTKTYFDMGFGMLLSGPTYYLAVGLRHLNTPNVGFLEESGPDPSNVPILYNFMAGTEVKIDRSGKLLFSPNILFALQGNLYQLNAGGHLKMDRISTGIYYRHAGKNPDALQLHIGFEQEIFRIGYSYDFTISQLAGLSGGSHELSLIINLDNQPGRRSVDYSDCLDIFR